MITIAKFRSAIFFLTIALGATTTSAYNGSDAFLHYYPAPGSVLQQYESVCRNIVVSDTVHDTLHHALAEFDVAMPIMLGGATLPRAGTPGAGSIVLAEQGSAPVAAAGINYGTVTGEGFIIQTINGATYISGTSQVGVLRGAFRFLRLMQTQKNITNLNIVDNPYFSCRVLDHWYNHYGSAVDNERLYGGKRAFKMEDFGNLSGAELTRVINYCRMAVSLGLNGMCPDNVNTYESGALDNYKCLEASNLANEKAFADLIGTYGLKYYLSVSYASPRLVTPTIASADAFHDTTMTGAEKWWYDKVDTVRAYIKNFGGFLLKADSEGEQGPVTTYGETESEGANPIAQALKRYGYNLIWRTFIYGLENPDFAICQSDEFANPAQTWDSSLILRSKDGPRDFQPIEPPNQLFEMPGVRHGLEFEITQEYTGQAIHLCWLVPRWKEFLDWNLVGASQWNGAAGTTCSQLIQGAGTTTGGIWGIGNLSDTVNWTGHFLAQANYYGFGRLAWNPNLSADSIADEWIRCSIDNGYNSGILSIVKFMLLGSWRAYTDYTIEHSALMPAVNDPNHYIVGYNTAAYSNSSPANFMDLTPDGIGVNRTNGAEPGSTPDDFVQFLTPGLADTFGTLTKCPEDYLLFFHHLPWGYTMQSGMSLFQQLEFEHYRGLHQVEKYIKYWNMLRSTAGLDSEIYAHVLSKLDKQLANATSWSNTFRSAFGADDSNQVPCRLDIMSADTTRAITAEVGASVNLSALLRTQNAKTWTGENFNWSVAEPGGTVTSATGNSTVFSANAPGIYTLTLSTADWPLLGEQQMIFVGKWDPVGVRSAMVQPAAHLSLKILQGLHRITITSPLAGKISIFSLQGRLVRSIDAGKAEPVVVDTRGFAGGLYVVKVQSATVTLQSRFFAR